MATLSAPRPRMWMATACCGAVAAVTSIAHCGSDVKINIDTPGTVQNEVRLVHNGALNTLIAAYNDLNGSVSPNPLGVSFSINGGLNWTDVQLSVPQDPFNPPGSTLPAIFDPFVGTSPINDVYVGYIATQGGVPLPGSGLGSGLFIERSENGGMTWSGPTMISADPPAVGAVFRGNDRPTMDVNPFGRVVVTWIKDVGVNAPTSDIYYAASNPPPGPGPGPFPPTGLSFGIPVTVNDNPNGTDFANVPDVAIHPNGKTYVAWIDVDVTVCDAATATIKIDRTQEPGPPLFGIDKPVATIDPLPKHLSTSAGPGTDDDARAGSYPAIAVDDGDGTGQTIYLAYAAEAPAGDEGDIFFTKSIDGGNNWTMPLRINDDSTITDQMHPAIDAFQSPSGTHVVIAWYDKRHCANDDRWDVYMTRSVNGGTTFGANRLVSDQTFVTATAVPTTPPVGATCLPAQQPEPWMGEYLGVDLDLAYTAHIAFTSTRNGDPRGDVYYDRIPASAVKPADINNSGSVNIDDLLAVINAWGRCPVCQSCPADINRDGTINIDDLLAVINGWG